MIRKTINRLLVGIMLMLMSSAAFSFSLYDYQGRCGTARTILTPLPIKKGVAVAYDGNGGHIGLDPEFVRTHSRNAIEFLYFHECGHITYGHTGSAYNTQNEGDADCYAARRFTRAYGRKQFEYTLQELEYLNGTTRNNKLMQCK